MPDNCLPLFRRCFSGIRQIDLMVHASIREIILITVILKISVHHPDGCRFIIIGSVVHHLDA